MNPKHLIPRLLSGKNQISRPEKDEIFKNVLAQVSPSKRRIWRLAPVLALSTVAALLLVPMAMNSAEKAPTRAAFSARGSISASADFSMKCTNRYGTCQPGDKLIFDLSASVGYQYFAAFAKRTDGVVMWYFPDSPGGESLDLQQRLRGGILDRGIILDDDYEPGRYQVWGIFSSTALTRSEIKERFTAGATEIGPGTTVVKRELEVQ